MARSQNGVDLLVQLAELVQAPVVDQSNRMNFPNTHPLNQSAQAQPLIRNADLIIGLEVSDFWNTVNQFIDNGLENGSGERQSRIKPGTKLITISSAELNQKSNYQDFQRFQSVDIVDGRRRRGFAALSDRGGEVGDSERSQGGL